MQNIIITIKYYLIKFLPKNFISLFLGKLSEINFPKPIMTRAIKIYGYCTGVNYSEIKNPIDSFSNLQNFFTRELKPDARKIDKTANSLVSPCDGYWGVSGKINDFKLLQIKNKNYSLRKLCRNDELSNKLNGGDFAVFYLSPADYHRFHVPCDGYFSSIKYIPGKLWPVNNIGLSKIDNLFSVNERVVAEFIPSYDENSVITMVAVGATVVGKIKINFDSLIFNNRNNITVTKKYNKNEHVFHKGQEWGQFLLGSTIIMITSKGLLKPMFKGVSNKLLLGETVGHMSKM